MTDATSGDGAADKTYTVKVQQNRELPTEDEYEIGDGYTPVVAVVDDGELWVTKTKEDDEVTESFVATYGRGTWVRCWVDEDE